MSPNEESSPHYRNGYYWGNKLAVNIESSIYKSIENAILKKEELLNDLTTQLEWNDDHEQVQDLKGFIQALKDNLND